MTASVHPRGAVSAILWGQWGYWSTLAIAVWSHAYVPAGSIRTVLVLTPVLMALVIVANALWIYRACDEYIRLKLLRSAAITAIAMAGVTLGYFFLESFGFPRLSALTVNLIGWSLFNLQMLYVIVRSR